MDEEKRDELLVEDNEHSPQIYSGIGKLAENAKDSIDNLAEKAENAKDEIEQTIEKAEEKVKSKKPLIIAIVIIVLIAIIIGGFAFSKKGEVTVEAQATLTDILAINELETLEYPYSAVATVNNEKGKLLYYVKYSATIVLGVDLSKLDIAIDETAKSVVVTVPDAEIKSYNINYDDLSFLQEKKHNDDDILNVTKKAIKDDLESRIEEDRQEMLDLAKENAINYLDARTRSLVAAFDDSYSVEVK